MIESQLSEGWMRCFGSKVSSSNRHPDHIRNKGQQAEENIILGVEMSTVSMGERGAADPRRL
jgi:hypothetical protein